ncbi:MAG: alpha/beta fold hydrolase [Proteobacteria bacterium]|nr:alpha/beta fold hydrolase [Pseudomonadota bacterium]
MPDNALLHYSQSGAGEPLIILHGLFGSGKNWQSLARVFAEHFKVYTLDLRNHGQSFHHQDIDYRLMVEDVYRLLQHLNINNCRVIGHSMGGKISMLLAVEHAAMVSQLVVADISPVPYPHEYEHLIEPILSLELDRYDSRSSIDAALQIDIPESSLRAFLMQNLLRDGEHWRWKVNWQAIKRNLDKITGYSELPQDWQVACPTLFIRGEKSNYIGEAEEKLIDQHFNMVAIKTLANAGHWLHAEQPRAFARLVLEFLLD